MTKEEFEIELESDFWKGYSLSLIKDRHFTCEDCHRTFVDNMNKLVVHPLTFKAIKPWEYNEEDLLVLCKDCCEKRKGNLHPMAGFSTSERIDNKGDDMTDEDSCTSSSIVNREGNDKSEHLNKSTDESDLSIEDSKSNLTSNAATSANYQENEYKPLISKKIIIFIFLVVLAFTIILFAVSISQRRTWSERVQEDVLEYMKSRTQATLDEHLVDSEVSEGLTIYEDEDEIDDD